MKISFKRYAAAFVAAVIAFSSIGSVTVWAYYDDYHDAQGAAFGSWHESFGVSITIGEPGQELMDYDGPSYEYPTYMEVSEEDYDASEDYETEDDYATEENYPTEGTPVPNEPSTDYGSYVPTDPGDYPSNYDYSYPQDESPSMPESGDFEAGSVNFRTAVSRALPGNFGAAPHALHGTLNAAAYRALGFGLGVSLSGDETLPGSPLGNGSEEAALEYESYLYEPIWVIVTPISDVYFGYWTQGEYTVGSYDDQDITPHTVSITSYALVPTTVNVSISGPGAEAFIVSQREFYNLAPGDSVSFNVRPGSDLAPGVYEAVVTVSGNLVFATPRAADGVLLTDYGTWFETAWALWQGEPNGTYHVYVRAESAYDWRNNDPILGALEDTDNGWDKIDGFVRVDQPLVRLIDPVRNTWRVDVPGLPRGTYDLEIRNGDGEVLFYVEGLQTRTFPRYGAAFVPSNQLIANSADTDWAPYGATGGYLPDGRVDPNAFIMYVSHGPTTGANIGWDDFTPANLTRGSVQRGDRPAIVRFLGTIGDFEYVADTHDAAGAVVPPGVAQTGNDMNRHFTLATNSHQITFEGIGPDAVLYGWGVFTGGAQNVVFHNLSLCSTTPLALEYPAHPGMCGPTIILCAMAKTGSCTTTTKQTGLGRVV